MIIYSRTALATDDNKNRLKVSSIILTRFLEYIKGKSIYVNQIGQK